MSGNALREALTAAYEAKDEEEEETVATTTEEEEEEEEIVVEPPKEEEEEEEEEPPATSEEEEEEEEEPPAGEEVGPAPVSWKPEARESWGKLPATVRQEVQRRELEIQRTLTQTGEARKIAEEFREAVRPFEGLIAAENSTPVQAVRNLMQTAAGLKMGTPQQRANIISDIINNYGVDLQVLDQVLTARLTGGQMPNPQEAQFQSMIQQQLAPYQQHLQKQQERERIQRMQAEQATKTEIQEWSKDKEFFRDVHLMMADITEARANQGIDTSLQEAYDLACLAHPSVKATLEQRAQVAKQQQQQGRSRRRRASSSLPASGGGAGGGESSENNTVRGALMNALEKHG